MKSGRRWNTQSLVGCSHQILFHWAQGTPWKRRQNDCHSQRGQRRDKNTRPFKYSTADACITHRDYGSKHQACMSLQQMGFQSQREKWTYAPTPNPEAASNLQPTAREKLVSSKGISKQTTLKDGLRTSSRWPTERELNDIFEVYLFHNVGSGHFFCLMGPLHIYSGFCLLLLVSYRIL